MNQQLADRIRSHTLPLYATIDGRLRLDGCSTLIEVGGKYYLITADHVGLHRGDMFMQLAGPLSISDFGHHLRSPQADIAIFQVKNPNAIIMNSPSRFVKQFNLGIDHVPNPVERGKNYIVAGFPSSKAKPLWGNSSKFSLTLCAFHTKIVRPSADSSLAVDSRLYHIVRHMSEHVTIGNSSNRGRPPSLKGISGSGLWHHSKTGLRLVGIVTEQLPPTKPQYIVATKIEVVTEVIRQNWDPAIRRSRRLLVNVST